jgi:hypothetical protein
MSSNQQNYMVVDIMILLYAVALALVYYVARQISKEIYYEELRRKGVRV